ncbi:MAG: PD40 domain-containing protein [Planctomycetes bacterium]|nr:PD40 domain-containing protein [Planctomycetota bacterium]
MRTPLKVSPAFSPPSEYFHDDNPDRTQLLRAGSRVPCAIGRAFAATVLAVGAHAQVTERVNLGPGTSQSNWGADLWSVGCHVSADGRYVVFRSFALDLVPGDTNAAWDIFVRDRETQTIERVSVDSNGAQANDDSGQFGFSISADGRFVVFFSTATNLVPGGSNGPAQIFLHDRSTGATELISRSSTGVQGNAQSSSPSVSDDGRFVEFESHANNLVANDVNGLLDVFVRDRRARTTSCVSVDPAGHPGNGVSNWPAISGDGRWMAFASSASNLVLGDSNSTMDGFVRDRVSGITEKISLSTNGVQANLASGGAPSISRNGRFVAFMGSATNLVPGDTNNCWDVFVRDRQTGKTERASVATGGAQSFGNPGYTSISANGRFVAFASDAQDLVSPISGGLNVFVHDRRNDTTELASVSTSGGLADNTSDAPSISANGRFVVFRSNASNLVPNDTNGAMDILLHDRDSTGFVSVCAPGDGNVVSPAPAAILPGARAAAATTPPEQAAPRSPRRASPTPRSTAWSSRPPASAPRPRACSCRAMPSCRTARSSARESAVPAARSSACT